MRMLAMASGRPGLFQQQGEKKEAKVAVVQVASTETTSPHHLLNVDGYGTDNIISIWILNVFTDSFSLFGFLACRLHGRIETSQYWNDDDVILSALYCLSGFVLRLFIAFQNNKVMGLDAAKGTTCLTTESEFRGDLKDVFGCLSILRKQNQLTMIILSLVWQVEGYATPGIQPML
ncbi:hypothetical protein M8C21_018449, partial [Ambrosia artemisiifolia]